MVTNFFKLSWRHLAKNRAFGLINLWGLAFGLAAAMAVVLYVWDEFSFESFNVKADRIMRINLSATFDGEEIRLGSVPNATAGMLEQQLPEVEKAVRVFPHKYGATAFVRAGADNFAEQNFFWADPAIFQVFSFDLQGSSPAEVLAQPNTVVLSASTARRYFGDSDPLGQTLKVDNTYDLTVTGVFADLPHNTHFRYDLIGSFQTIPDGQPERSSWGNASFLTFLLLNPGVDPVTLDQKIADAVTREVPADRQWFTLHAQPLRDMHLYSDNLTIISPEPFGDAGQVRILIGLAIALLLIACVNYMNLATAKSQDRIKEVAVSKTLGASAGRLALQFYFETALLALAGIVLSLVILSLALPFFNEISGKELSIGTFLSPIFAITAVGVWLVVTLVAGAYPAAYLSSFTPLEVLRQHYGRRSGAGLVRQGLVVFQFGISTALIISTLVFFQQLNFIRHKKLGFNPEEVVAIRITGAENRQQVEALAAELGALPAVASVGLSQSFPGQSASGRSLRRPNAGDGEEGAQLTSCRANPEVLEVLDLPLLAGRTLRRPVEGDSIAEVVLNRSAVEYLGYTPEEAIGRPVEADLGPAQIVGVVEDFHFGSLRERIGNYAFHNRNSEWLEYLLVRLETNELFDVMAQLKTSFDQVMPTSAFDYIFLDQQLDTLYRAERRLAKVVLVFAALAIFVACLGLFALVAFTAEQRTKEIGIRKVLGATVGNLVALLSKDFLRLVAISIVIAAPVAWLAMSRWLNNFAYRVDLEWWVFALAGALAIVIALLTVSYTSIRTALGNPVEALQDE